MAMNYLDFDLSIEAIDSAAGRYRAHVLASPSGEANTEFVLPFSAVEVENYILKMGRPRQGVRGLNSSEGRAAQEFGRKLYEALFQGPVRDCLRSSLSTVNQQADQGLRLRLRLNDAPALADLPWEYLYDTSFRRFFAHSAATPIVRYLDLPERIQPLAVQPPLKILVMIASPRDVGQLDVEGEWRKVQAALADLVQRGLVTLTRLEKATLTALQRQLRREQCHIFHFIGHGGFDQQTQEGVLLLENENGLVRMVAGGTLGALLHDHRSLRLAVLNACEGARTAPSDPFAGVAQTLVQQGIPAVIAMQFEITDRAAITFAHEFYSALADRYPVDAALAEARKAILAEGNDVEWGTPVLYLRAQDGNIFDLVAPHEISSLPPPKVDPEPVKPTPRQSIFQGRFYLVGAALILLVLGSIWLAPRLATLWQPGAPTLTPTTTATATMTTPTPNLTVTANANAGMQTALATPETTLAPTAMLTPTAIPAPTRTVTNTPAPTPPSAPKTTATTTKVKAIVNTPLVNIRSGPGTDFDIIATVDRGEEYEIVGKNAKGDWWKVCCVDNKPGWVSTEFVDTDGPLDSIAIIKEGAQFEATATLSSDTAAQAASVEPTTAPTAPTTDQTVTATTPANTFGFMLLTQEQFPETKQVRIFLYVYESGSNALEGYSLVVTKDGSTVPVNTASFGGHPGFTWPVADVRQRFQNMKVEFPGVTAAGTWVVQLSKDGKPVGPPATFTLKNNEPNEELYVRYERQN